MFYRLTHSEYVEHKDFNCESDLINYLEKRLLDTEIYLFNITVYVHEKTCEGGISLVDNFNAEDFLYP